MRVTDAMVERATRSLREDFALDTAAAARYALEAALADVPDPYEQTSALVNADRRLAELEAKLEKMRKLAAEDGGFLARGVQLLEQADAHIAELEAKLAKRKEDSWVEAALDHVAELEAKLARMREPATDADVSTFEQAWVVAERDEMSKRAATEVRHLERVCTLAGVDAVLRERDKGDT